MRSQFALDWARAAHRLRALRSPRRVQRLIAKSFKYGLRALGSWRAFGGVAACAGCFLARGSIPRLGTWAASRGSNNRVNLTRSQLAHNGSARLASYAQHVQQGPQATLAHEVQSVDGEAALRRFVRLAVALALVSAVAAGPAACQSPTANDEAALKAANAQVGKYNAGYQVAFDALGEMSKGDKSPATWARKAERLKEAEARMPERRATLDAATAEWRKVADMKVSSDARRYAALMAELLPVKLREEAKTSEILAAMREFCEYFATGKTVQSVANDKAAAIARLDQEAVDISAEVFAKQKDAAKYSAKRGSFFRTWAENPSDY